MSAERITVPFTVAAPGRVNLIGEHVDYNDGFVLPMAIERQVRLRVRPRADRRVLLRTGRSPETVSLDLSAPLEPRRRHWSNYVAGVIEGCRRAGLEPPGFEADVEATLPAGGGLSSSAALEVATATAIEALCGRELGPERKALLCQAAEHEFAGVPCGIMDQFAVCFARPGHALCLDCRARSIVPVPIGSGLRVLVINSGVKHALADGAYAQRRAECAEAAARLGVGSLRDLVPADLDGAARLLPTTLLARARHVVGEIARVPAFVAALAAGDRGGAGALLAESHRSLAHDYAVSCPELDLLVDLAAGVPGIVGCRMTGGGFGGCVVALVEEAGADEAAAALVAAYRGGRGIDAEWFLTAAAGGPTVTLD